ncbi:hypothetical protein ACQP10_24980 [Streptosporangium sandarakinum]|uniref:hypothetical protein n=1 Tax=Streptosporangium sandarakinum TaxID=1260955 RepID=UPI003D93A909
MKASIASFSLHKEGGTEDEYEDAFETFPDEAGSDGVHVSVVRMAVSDGASESALAGRWARSLTRWFVQAPSGTARSADEFAGQVVNAVRSWEATLGDYVAKREAEGRPIQWYEQPKLDRGAYATLLTVDFSVPPCEEAVPEPAEEIVWYAAAMGDSALFHVRDGKLVTAFPMTHSGDFNLTPDLVNSRTMDADLIAGRVRLHKGTLRQGDDVYMCTDAVAAWFLTEAERGCRPWELLRDLGTRDGQDFATLVREERASGRMRNDDVTLLHMDVW